MGSQACHSSVNRGVVGLVGGRWFGRLQRHTLGVCVWTGRIASRDCAGTVLPRLGFDCMAVVSSGVWSIDQAWQTLACQSRVHIRAMAAVLQPVAPTPWRIAIRLLLICCCCINSGSEACF